MVRSKKAGISRTVIAIIIIVVLIVALIAIELHFVGEGPTQLNIYIVETDPVLQLDHFFPTNVTVRQGQTYQLAVDNEDDELRDFVVKNFNINFTIPAGETQRGTITPNTNGAFEFWSNSTPPSAVSQGRDGPFLNGTLVVTTAAIVNTNSTNTSSTK